MSLGFHHATASTACVMALRWVASCWQRAARPAAVLQRSEQKRASGRALVSIAPQKPHRRRSETVRSASAAPSDSELLIVTLCSEIVRSASEWPVPQAAPVAFSSSLVVPETQGQPSTFARMAVVLERGRLEAVHERAVMKRRALIGCLRADPGDAKTTPCVRKTTHPGLFTVSFRSHTQTMAPPAERQQISPTGCGRRSIGGRRSPPSRLCPFGDGEPAAVDARLLSLRPCPSVCASFVARPTVDSGLDCHTQRGCGANRRCR